jgi:hypothetical protein
MKKLTEREMSLSLDNLMHNKEFWLHWLKEMKAAEELNQRSTLSIPRFIAIIFGIADLNDNLDTAFSFTFLKVLNAIINNSIREFFDREDNSTHEFLRVINFTSVHHKIKFDYAMTPIGIVDNFYEPWQPFKYIKLIDKPCAPEIKTGEEFKVFIQALNELKQSYCE